MRLLLAFVVRSFLECKRPFRSTFGKAIVLSWLILLFAGLSQSQAEPLSYYLPRDAKFRKSVPTPKSYFGFEVGEFHIRHHQLVGYARKLAEASPLVRINEYARTHGSRPLVTLTITSPENHKRIKQIRAQHRMLADPATASKVDVAKLPAVIYMGYSVHGNESSASNAVPLVAYYLAATEGDRAQEMLQNMVVIIDPCLNPDGFDRFAHWANSGRGKAINADPNHREHNEPWPNGRTNYYFFDLNRDWLPVQHPESQGRIDIYHQWKPNVVLDFHEMGTSSTYFFQPGIPTRNNPLTPKRTFELTADFAKYHSKALDGLGSLYYTEERFDDFYMGKGSTYPDLHGAVGILFEQASSRGHKQESPNGTLTFGFTIRNQVRTSISSLNATTDLRLQLHEHLKTFYANSLKQAKADKVRAYIVATKEDPMRLHEFHRIIARHDIKSYWLTQDAKIGNQTFVKQKSLVIPTEQPEYLFLRSLMEKRTKFDEPIFYDVSTWTLPLAFDLEYAELANLPTTELKGSQAQPKHPARTFKADAKHLAFLVSWRDYYAAKLLYRLLDSEIKVKVATRTFSTGAGDNVENWPIGTLMIPLGIQPQRKREIVSILAEGAKKDGIRVVGVQTGLTPKGIDLGSSNFRTLKRPRILLVAGSGVRAYEAGEAWHLLDARFGIPVTLVEDHRLQRVKLDNYTTIVMVSGTYTNVTDAAVENIKSWVSSGGTLVTFGGASSWVSGKGLASLNFASRRVSRLRRQPSIEAEKHRALQLISGAIFNTSVDTTHPLGYGFVPENGEFASVPVFRNHTAMLTASSSPFSKTGLYTTSPLLSGYASSNNVAAITGTASLISTRSGSGRVIVLVDNPNFRAFWYGTNRFFLNAIFMQ